MTRHHGKYISYLRVSTAKQGQSGLGLEAQRAAVASFLNGGNWQVLEEIVEIESGKSHRNRPELQRALAACKVYGAKLIISRLDRLSRDPVFLLSLRDAGIDFVCCDNPQATRLTIGVLAMVAEQEREAISTRTKSALQADKARGVKLGNPRPETAGFHNRRAAKAAQESADKFAELIRPLLEGDLARLSANSTAQELNRRGVQTPRGGTWTATSILNLKARLKP
jgi:DNA invertase Pin-like site-specific DNA recombinase